MLIKELLFPKVGVITFVMRNLTATIFLITYHLFVNAGVSQSVGYLEGWAKFVEADHDFTLLELNSLAE